MRFEVTYALQGLGELERGQGTPRFFRTRFFSTEALRFDEELESKAAARHVLSSSGSPDATRLLKTLLAFDSTLHVVDR